jgi:hypothetical protein
VRLTSAVLRSTASYTVFLAACVQSPAAPRVEDQPISLTVSVSTSSIRIGDTDTITVTASNRLSNQVRLVFPTTCQIKVYIRDARGRIHVPNGGRYECVPVPTQIIFPANGSVSRQFIWRGYDQFDPPGSQTPLPPGTYFVSAEMTADGYSTFAFPVRVDILP